MQALTNTELFSRAAAVMKPAHSYATDYIFRLASECGRRNLRVTEDALLDYAWKRLHPIPVAIPDEDAPLPEWPDAFSE
jgi:hypothetical protein